MMEVNVLLQTEVAMFVGSVRRRANSFLSLNSMIMLLRRLCSLRTPSHYFHVLMTVNFVFWTGLMGRSFPRSKTQTVESTTLQSSTLATFGLRHETTPSARLIFKAEL